MFEASLGSAQHHKNLTAFPILAEKDRILPYLLMADALAAGALTIGEKNGGQVPLLSATNAGPEVVLILDGEQLIGARQNRMTNRSILLAPSSTTEIPVSCMEQGRWHFVGEAFAAAPQHAPSKVRRKAREQEAVASYAADARGPGARSSYRELASAQGEVWDEIRHFGRALGGTSSTGALDAIYAGRRGEVGHWLEAYPLLPRQVGLVAFTGRRPLGMDTLGAPGLFSKLHRRILTGYILDAMEGGAWPDGGPEPRERRRPGPTPLAQAERFVEAARGAERRPSDSVGLGEYRILRGAALGGELVNEGHLVHLSAFPAENRSEGRDAPAPAGQGGGNPDQARPIARPSHRRRRF